MLAAMKDIYSRLYSAESAEVLVRSIRRSTEGQYQSIWGTFCSFLRSLDPPWVSQETILSFLRYLFFDRKLAPSTVSSYRSALAKPLLLLFHIDVSANPFVDCIRALFNLRPSSPSRKFSWSLDRVLDFILSNSLFNSLVVESSLMCSLFLLSLASGKRVSELSACLRLDEFLTFSDDSLTLYPNPNFLAKNEDPARRWDPLVIPRLKDEEGGPHPLCPVAAISHYLSLTSSTSSQRLFVHPVSMGDITIHKLRWYLCKIIKRSNPGSIPKAHDLRKMAATFAFFSHVSLSEICSLVGWKSIRTFKRHYLMQIQSLSSKILVMGKATQ